MTQLPIPVHVGSEPPSFWDDIEARQKEYGEEASSWLQEKRRPAVASPDLDWRSLGFEPRWIDSETADCAAALQPSVFSGHGADEFNRFRQGAASRSELAIVISPIGKLDEETRNIRSVFGPPVDSVSIGPTFTSVNGRLLGKEARVRPVDDLSDVDGHLARRLLSCNPPPRWSSLSLNGAVMESIYGREQHDAEGSLVPILETELGEPVVAAWLSPDGVERRYIVPAEAPWPSLLQWLQGQALPELVPGAMRRARRQLGTDVFLMTRAERTARKALTDLDSEYAVRKKELQRQLSEAETAASAIREGLLYGSGPQLADAVLQVLGWAGLTVIDLDNHLGDTKSADLLCTYAGHSRLVEVKSASGNAPERAYQDLVRHLREWSDLPGSTPVDGGALVINHEHRKIPQERRAKPYERPEFLASQTEPVISTLDLFSAWREEDAVAVRRLMFGLADIQAPAPVQAASAPTDPGPRKRGWLRRP